MTRRQIQWAIYGLYLIIFVCLSMSSFDWNFSVKTLDDLSLANHLADLEGGSIYRRIGLLVLTTTAVVVLWRRGWPSLSKRGVVPIFCFGFLTISYGSLLWDQDHALIAKRLALLTIMLLAAFTFAYRFTLRQIITLAATTTTLTFFSGIAAEMVHNTFRPWTSDYRFGGVMHPNSMAENCSIMLISLLPLIRYNPAWRRWLIALALTTFVFLVFTKSRTACGAGLFGVAVYCMLVWPRRKVVTAFLTLGTVAGLLLAVFSSDLLSTLPQIMLMGRAHEAASSTLSNRIPLWQECWEYISQKPFTGYGYQGFWTPERTIVISAHQGWVVPHSHNQYIEVSLWIGLIGAAAFALTLLGVIRRSYSWARLAGNPAWAFMTAALSYWTLNMLLEATGLFIDLTSLLLMILVIRVAFPPQRVARAPVTARLRRPMTVPPSLAFQPQRRYEHA